MMNSVQPRVRSSPRCVIRADASIHIGSGHIMRCLTLADTLRARGYEVVFVMREHAGHLASFVGSRGYGARLLSAPSGRDEARGPYAHSSWLGVSQEQDAEETLAALGSAKFELLIVDHYALGAPFEARLKASASLIVAIDDLADRPHHADVLCDASLPAGETPEALYRPLLRADASILGGPDYALLRPEFLLARPEALARRRASVDRILITMGGVDAEDWSSRILRALIPYMPAEVVLVMGSRAPALGEVSALARSLPYPVSLHIDTEEMARLMAMADLAIGAAGGTAYERACLGLPSLMLALAANQRTNLDGLVGAGAALELKSADLEGERLATCLRGLGGERLSAMSIAAAALVDGRGAERVTEAIDAFMRVR